MCFKTVNKNSFLVLLGIYYLLVLAEDAKRRVLSPQKKGSFGHYTSKHFNRFLIKSNEKTREEKMKIFLRG